MKYHICDVDLAERVVALATAIRRESLRGQPEQAEQPAAADRASRGR